MLHLNWEDIGYILWSHIRSQGRPPVIYGGYVQLCVSSSPNTWVFVLLMLRVEPSPTGTVSKSLRLIIQLKLLPSPGTCKGSEQVKMSSLVQ